jgi:DNA-binding CsgD family transcriptional regulator
VIALAILVVVQVVASAFFVGDVLYDLSESPGSTHSLVEAFVSVALLVGIAFGIRELSRMLNRMRAQEAALAAAGGALADVIRVQFDAWGLTPAEADVGFLALKGLDVGEIAGLRGAAKGTVRAQLTSIYTKANVSGRAQFAAFFVEDLLSVGVPQPSAKPHAQIR